MDKGGNVRSGVPAPLFPALAAFIIHAPSAADAAFNAMAVCVNSGQFPEIR
jgi:hypothetical protein